MTRMWPYVGMLALAIFALIAVQRCRQEWAAKQTAQETDKRAAAIGKVEAGRQDVQRREQKVYPVINKKLQQVKEYRTKLAVQERNLAVPKREEILHEVQKDDIDALADRFRHDGYPCSVLER